MILFKPEDISRCKKFANESNNDNYAARNQRNAAVKARQIYQGKLGEIAAHAFLLADCPSLTEPDFKIYPANQKNWKSDITCGNEHYHIKTMGTDQAAIYGLSWTFQFSDARGKGGKDTAIFGNKADEKAFICFVEVDLKKGGALIHSVLFAKRLFDEDLFREPKLDYLKGIKKVVYFSDIEDRGLVGKFDHRW